MPSILYDKEINQPVFSGHETFPLRYGWLKKVYDEMEIANNNKQDAKDIFNKPASIATFGVGKNMVSSMRHWATYANVINDNKLTKFAKEIFPDDGLDPWMENSATLWLLHWNIARSEKLVTYYWFFNFYNGGTFDRKQMNEEVYALCVDMDWKLPSLTTLKRDVECFIRMYAGKDFSTKAYNDDSIESPLTEISLIKPLRTNGYFSANRGHRDSLSCAVYLYAVCDFWVSENANSSSLSLESLMYDPCSPGRVFLLDEENLIGLSYKAAELAEKHLNWSETAGLKQFTLKPNVTAEELKEMAWANIIEEYQL